MKKSFLFVMLLISTILLIGCSSKINSETDLSSSFVEEEIDFKIDQIVFSKSFQSTEPSVEILTNNNLSVIASLGLSEYFSINVNKVIKKGNEVNIHVSGISDESQNRLAVPQIMLEFKKSDLRPTDKIKFNIVYDDYTPIKIKLGLNEVLNQIQTTFKVSSKTTPSFNLIKNEEILIWDIYYNSIFEKETLNSALIDLKIQVNANTGEIINSDRNVLSTTIDTGSVLNYSLNKYLLYKKPIVDSTSNKTIEQLWMYNVDTKENNMIYSSSFKIHTAELNQSSNHVALIESNDNGSDLYIISLNDTKAYKVFFEQDFNPKSIKWNDNRLYMIENTSNKSTIASYDVKSNTLEIISSFNKNLDSIDTKSNKFIVTESKDNDINKTIYTTTHWKSLHPVDEGFDIKFIDKTRFAYLQKNMKTDSNSIIIYDLEENSSIMSIDENVTKYYVLSNGDIAYLKKNTNKVNYTLSVFSFKNKESKDISTFIEDEVFYNSSNNKVYLNIKLPFDSNKTEIIYEMNINNRN